MMDVVPTTTTNLSSASSGSYSSSYIDETRIRHTSSPVVNLSQNNNNNPSPTDSDDDSEEFPLTDQKKKKTSRKILTEEQEKEKELKEFRDQYEKEKISPKFKDPVSRTPSSNDPVVENEQQSVESSFLGYAIIFSYCVCLALLIYYKEDIYEYIRKL